MEILLSYIGYPYLAEDLEVEKLRAVAAIAPGRCMPSQPAPQSLCFVLPVGHW